MRKKTTGSFLLVFLAACTAAWAMTPDEARQAHRQEMKQIKQAQHEAKKSNPAPAGPSKWDIFWKKEGERSGVGQTGSGASNLLSRLNPLPFLRDQQDKYNARKAPAAGR